MLSVSVVSVDLMKDRWNFEDNVYAVVQTQAGKKYLIQVNFEAGDIQY